MIGPGGRKMYASSCKSLKKIAIHIMNQEVSNPHFMIYGGNINIKHRYESVIHLNI